MLKRVFLALVTCVILLGALNSPVLASRKDYFDWGPYYLNSPQVLGFSFSSLEELPSFTLPDTARLTTSPGILPGNPLYPLERFAEGVALAFTFDPAGKQEARLAQASERLAEAQESMATGNMDAFSSAIFDYQSTLAAVNENLSQTPGMLDKVNEVATNHAVLVQNISYSAPPTASETLDIAIESARETLDGVADAKGEPPIPEALSTSIQKLKEQGLVTEEETDKIYTLATRSRVREELEKLASVGQFPPAEGAKLDTAVSEKYPEIYSHTLNNLEFAELRTYQTLPQPTGEIETKIARWEAGPSDTPPPAEVRPYLYSLRGRDLATAIDLSKFEGAQAAEVTKFYPDEVVKNPTYSSITPVTPLPLESSASEEATQTSPTEVVTGGSDLVQSYITRPGGPLPGETLYFGKRLFEQFTLATTFDPRRRLEYQMRLAEERLGEASVLSGKSDHPGEYETALNRYKDEVGSLSANLKDYPESKVKEDLAKRLEAQAARHEAVFETGLIPAPTGNYKIIGDVIIETERAMDRAADALDKPALPTALTFRLQDLKAQGLVLEEEIADLTQSTTREEVREKVRKLSEEGGLPSAEAKRLDDAQSTSVPTNYNQLVEVRKVEELQSLRAVQTQLAQTPTLKATADSLTRREEALTQSIDISSIRTEDLVGREDLRTAYQTLQATASARPINRGQFGNQPPPPTDAVLTACPLGSIFKQFEGCVWADSGKKINDYNQYRCDKAGQYYSFPAKKCVPNQPGFGFGDDSKPVCPVGYSWVWGSQSCQTSTEDKVDPKYRCPDGQYYSPDEEKCVPIPKPGDPFPDACPEQNTYWSFSEEKCIAWPKEGEGKFKDLSIPQPVFVTPDNPFYPVKGWGEFFQRTFAFTPQRREAVTLDQAKERLAEAAYALKKEDKEGVKRAISLYTEAMQNIVADVSKESLNSQAKAEIAKILSEESLEQNLLLSKLTAWADDEQDAVLAAATSVTILGIDKSADVAGEPSIPEDVKAKIEALPAEMIAEEDKKKLLETNSRVAARVEINKLVAAGGLAQEDTGFLYRVFQDIDSATSVEIEELKKLAEIVDIADKKRELTEKVEKNEDIAVRLDEFQRTFEPGDDIPSAIRPYVRLTRIDEVAQTIRPDIVNLENFANRKDVQLAVATLQQEYRPTRESIARVEDFRRRNPNSPLPPDLARIEAFSVSLGVRDTATACFLPTPPFPANTPCPPPGAAIPLTSYYPGNYPGIGGFGQTQGRESATNDASGKLLVYGQGPTAASPGTCPDGYHWMYDSDGWCMSNSGSYGSSYSYTPTGTGSGYTPYSPYYTAPGAPPGTYGYPVGDVSPNDGCPYGYDSDGRGNCIPNSYPGGNYSYSPPSYYGTAPTYYTTTPPSGTVPGSGPRPTSPGQCPSGYHWMSDSGGWCMADGGTYVPAGTGGFGSGGYSGPGTGYSSPSSYQYGCAPGNYWDGSKCVTGSYEGPGWSDTAARSGSWCQPPSNGCGSNSYWDYGSCSCRSSSSTTTYSSGYNTGTGTCTGQTCGSGQWFDWGTCSCRPTGDTYTGSTSTGSTSGSCPSGYHWMSDSGGWCMSDGGGGGSSTTTTTTSSPAPSTTTTGTEPAPTQTTTTTSQPPPASTEPAPSSPSP